MKAFPSLMSCLTLVLVGCSTTPSRAPLIDIHSMRPDCFNRDLQLRYLQSQLGLKSSYFSGGSFADLLGGLGDNLHGNAKEKQQWYDRKYIAITKEKIWDIRAACP